MKGSYKFLEHTADVGIEIISPSLPRLYELAGEALFNLIAPETSGSTFPKTVQTQGDSPESLLVNFLNDLLYQFEVDRLLFRELNTQSLEAHSLVVEARCEKWDEESSGVHPVVKAATWHDLLVEKHDDHWRAVVYLDL